jgi:hypothetical protein
LSDSNRRPAHYEDAAHTPIARSPARGAHLRALNAPDDLGRRHRGFHERFHASILQLADAIVTYGVLRFADYAGCAPQLNDMIAAAAQRLAAVIPRLDA